MTADQFVDLLRRYTYAVSDATAWAAANGGNSEPRDNRVDEISQAFAEQAIGRRLTQTEQLRIFDFEASSYLEPPL